MPFTFCFKDPRLYEAEGGDNEAILLVDNFFH